MSGGAREVVHYANDVSCEILGRVRSRLVAEVLAPLQSLSSHNRHAELTVQRGDGEPVIVGYSMTRARGAPVLLFQDVSQLVALRGERDRLMRLAAVGEVLPSLLHELRNPLAVITSAVEVLVEDTADDALQGELHAILSELRRMDLGFQGLGSVGRSLSSERAQPIDFAVEEAARVTRTAVAAAGLRLTVHQPAMPLLRLDASVVRAVVFNLLTNSMHACRAGDHIVVRSGMVDGGHAYRLAVADTGQGMSNDVLARCTELFDQAGRERHRAGAVRAGGAAVGGRGDAAGRDAARSGADRGVGGRRRRPGGGRGRVSAGRAAGRDRVGPQAAGRDGAGAAAADRRGGTDAGGLRDRVVRDLRGQLPPTPHVEVYEKPLPIARLREVVSRHLEAERSQPVSPFAVADHLQLAELGRHSVVLEITCDGVEMGRVTVVRGAAWDAHTGAQPRRHPGAAHSQAVARGVAGGGAAGRRGARASQPGTSGGPAGAGTAGGGARHVVGPGAGGRGRDGGPGAGGDTRGEALSCLAELNLRRRQVPLLFLSAERGQGEGWLLTRVDVEVHPKPIAPSQLRQVVLRRLQPVESVGDDSPFSVADCLQLARMGQRTVRLHVSRQGAPLGTIDVVRGDVWSARAEERVGEGALVELATGRDSVAQVSPLPQLPARDITTSWEQLVSEADRGPLDDMARPADPEASLTGHIDALAGELADLRIQEGLEAMLREDHAAAWMAFSAAAAARSDDPTVRLHRDRLRAGLRRVLTACRARRAVEDAVPRQIDYGRGVLRALVVFGLVGCTAELPLYPDAGGEMGADAVLVDAVVDAARADGPVVDSRLPDAVALDGQVPDALDPDAATDAAGPDARLGDGSLDAVADAVVDGAADSTPRDAAPPDGPRDAAPPDMPCIPLAEGCNALDDDCDGAVDEGAVCGTYVAQQCRLWLGWADVDRAPRAPAAAWADCPGADRDEDGELRCVSTVGQSLFRRMTVQGDVDENDWFGVRLTCVDAVYPAQAAWVQARCQVALAQADRDRDPAAQDPRGCPVVEAGDNDGPDPRCVRSGGDGLFHPMRLRGDINDDDALAIAFFCDDPADPARAAAVEGAAEAYIGFQNRRAVAFGACDDDAHGDGPSWGGCPGDGSDDTGRTRCAGSAGDGAFHTVHYDHDARRCDVYAIALRAR